MDETLFLAGRYDLQPIWKTSTTAVSRSLKRTITESVSRPLVLPSSFSSLFIKELLSHPGKNNKSSATWHRPKWRSQSLKRIDSNPQLHCRLSLTQRPSRGDLIKIWVVENYRDIRENYPAPFKFHISLEANGMSFMKTGFIHRKHGCRLHYSGALR